MIAFVSQIDRTYNPARNPYPSLENVRLPNPVDLTAFDKTCFLNGDGVSFQTNT